MGDSKWRGICLLIAMGLLIGACRSPIGPPPNEALGHWLYRTQGLVGVFPPREDVRVGDVHLYLNDPDGDDHASLYQAPRWSYLPGTGEYASIRSMIIIMSSIGGAENTA